MSTQGIEMTDTLFRIYNNLEREWPGFKKQGTRNLLKTIEYRHNFGNTLN